MMHPNDVALQGGPVPKSGFKTFIEPHMVHI